MTVSAESIPVEVTLRGNVGSGAGEYARSKVAQALRLADKPVLHAHVVLQWRHDPAVESPATAEATVEIDGTIFRAESVAPSMTEAVDELESRLRRQLVQLQNRVRDRHRRAPGDTGSAWRHGDPPRRPLAFFPRPAESREVVRRKSFASSAMTADEAAAEMDLLDHDFFLYLDQDSTAPALVHRRTEGGFGVQGGPAAEPGAAVVPGVTREPDPPALTETQARERLEAGVEPFVFYLDTTSGEGQVLYLRYDGHYGLITLEPATGAG